MNYAKVFELTKREAEALKLAESGLSHQHIAAAMNISPSRACLLISTARDKRRAQSSVPSFGAGAPGASSLLWNARNRQPHISGHARFRAL